MTCEKSFEPLLSSNTFIVGLAKTTVLEVNNGLILASKQNQLCKLLIKNLRESYQAELTKLSVRIKKEEPVLQMLMMIDSEKAQIIRND